MSAARVATLAPFRVRSFRFQWPADLLTSLAFEMETLILGWYVLVETQSVLMLTFFASLTFVGTLLSPMFGVMGDRLGQRAVLSAMRAFYLVLATCMMIFALTDLLTPNRVLGIVFLLGLVRPSDFGVRNALIGDTVPHAQLMGAMGLQRVTFDSSRIVGALTGAGAVALLGMGAAYAIVASLYLVALVLTLQARAERNAEVPAAARVETPKRASPWHELKEGMVYVWRTPHLLALMLLAFLLNMTTFPMYSSLLPVVAKDVYGAGQTMLGYMVACGATGALVGSLLCSRFGAGIRPARLMIFGTLGWYAMILVFAHMSQPHSGLPALFLTGLFMSVGQVPMSVVLLRNIEARYRGRVMGIRMMAIYGNLPGLLLSGPLIQAYGYPAVATGYCIFGLVVATGIIVRWREHIWRTDAPTNARAG
jgi:predicted MFS family arabinose efflux permease